jgi:hypothetical protein
MAACRRAPQSLLKRIGLTCEPTNAGDDGVHVIDEHGSPEIGFNDRSRHTKLGKAGAEGVSLAR